MPKTIELMVPDLGGFEDVPIIELLIANGDTIGIDTPLVLLESDKATMEVPATAAGVIRSVKVKIGDRVSAGSILADIEVADHANSVEPVASVASIGEAPPSSQPAISSLAAPSPALAGGSVELTVPDLGGFTDVPIISVFITAGDVIATDAPLVELESDKATMEVPSLVGGTIRDVRVRVGDRVSPGSVLATVEPLVSRNGSSASIAPPSIAPPSIAPPVIAAVTAAPPSHNGSPAAPGGPNHASPAVRRFARELGVHVGGIKGSGPNNRVTREDVQRFVRQALVSGSSAATPASAVAGSGFAVLPWPKVDFAKFGPIEREPLSRIAKISGQNLARNWVMIPHVTQHDEADVTELEAFRKTINAEQSGVKVTMLALLMKALVTTLKQYPRFNSSLDGDELVLKHYYHLGFAADTPSGLVVPVIRDVDTKGVLDIAAQTSALAKKARDGKLGPSDMSGAGFTISSLGGIGGTAFTPIINAPEVAILGVSRTMTKPVWDGHAFVPRLMLPLSLSYDHRVIDGAAAARFCSSLAGMLADLRKSLL